MLMTLLCSLPLAFCEGYYAAMVLVDLNKKWVSTPQNTLYHCGWSPTTNYEFKCKVHSTFVNGTKVYDNGVFNETNKGSPLRFEKQR